MLTTVPAPRALCLVLAVLSSISLATAGEVHVSWGESDTATSYTLYRGTSSGQYSGSQPVGGALDATADGLTDCMMWYFAVTASNAGGESGFSEEVSSWPRAVLTSANPQVLEPGTQAQIQISGTNFRQGDTIEISNPGITIGSVSRTCTTLSLSVTVAANAATGPTDVLVTHPSGVTGIGAGLLVVAPPTPPTVVATSPLDGAVDVPLTVTPSVQFSEAVGGVTSSTVRLLNAQGTPVAQASGSPSLSPQGDVATITPASDLAFDSTYRIQVIGGSGGVHDMDGIPMAEDYLQPTGFTTVSDGTGPELSGIGATQVDGTSAVIVWTTNEPADSEVFYRPSGAQTYETVSSDTLVTSHSVQLTGLEPETTYQFHVASTDGSGNTTTSSPDDSFTTTTSPYEYLRFETEAGVLVNPVRVIHGPAAFGGAWIDTPPGSGNGTSNNPSGTATFGVLIPESGTWHLWVRMYAPNGSASSWFESVDGSPRQTITIGQVGQWGWVAGQSYSLNAGLHSVELGGRRAETRADRVLLTNDPDFIPNEQPGADIVPPGSVGALVAEAGPGQMQLSWTNPSDGDLANIVIRYRTDGFYPTSPVDGYRVTEQPGSPGADGSVIHDGLEPGVNYYYSAFAVDESGNVSEAAHVVGALMGVPPPPQAVSVY